MLDAARLWSYIGLNSFGGPAGQIAVMHREVVDERGLVRERQFVHALNFSMLLPGPEAQQLATYLGWLSRGVRGGLLAGSLFVLPGAIVMLGISVLYVSLGDVGWVAGLLFGLQAAVVVIVFQALRRMAARTLHTKALWVIACVAFVALFLLSLPFPLVVVCAGAAGYVLGRRQPGWLPRVSADDDVDLIDPAARARALRAASVALAAWLIPLAGLFLTLGGSHILTQIGWLFSKTALVSFGGAYAGLAYVSQVAVVEDGWISADQMTTGLGLAETTPGPLVLVMQFVGFLAAYQSPGALAPLLAGMLGAAIALWMTFVPCFVLVFAGAPFAEALRHRAGLQNALSGIGAAVVGVIANLGAWFALATFFTVDERSFGPLRFGVPDWSSLDARAVLIAAVAGLLLFAGRWSTVRVLGVCAAIGVVIGGFA